MTISKSLKAEKPTLKPKAINSKMCTAVLQVRSAPVQHPGNNDPQLIVSESVLFLGYFERWGLFRSLLALISYYKKLFFYGLGVGGFF